MLMFESMEQYLCRFMDLFDRTGPKYRIHGNQMWICDRNMVFPFGPASHGHFLQSAEAEDLLRELGGLLIRWTDGFGDGKSDDWYAVICDAFRPAEASEKKTRWEIRKGLGHCHAERVEAKYVADNGPVVNAEAMKSHRFTEDEIRQFRLRTTIEQDYSDIVHYWGIFHEGKFIGYSKNFIFGTEEASYSTIRVCEDHQKSYASYSLIYRMNEHYLNEAQVKYVNDGFKTIHHPTNIQSFLIKKFGFRRANTNLSVAYKTWLKGFVGVTYPFHLVFREFNSRLRALYLLEGARRSSQNAKEMQLTRTLSTPPQEGGR